MGGGILYNKKIFADNEPDGADDLGRVRREQRQAEGAGIAPIGATYKAHLDVPAVRARGLLQRPGADPDFAEQYTNNKIKYADTPAALAGFQHLQEAFDKGWYAEGLRFGHVRRRLEHAGDRTRSRSTRC